MVPPKQRRGLWTLAFAFSGADGLLWWAECQVFRWPF